MQNLWLKRCKCGRVAVEFRSRKDLYVDSVRQVYCPRCLKEAKSGSLIVDIRKWGSSTAKDSDTGVYAFLYNKDAILRRNKGMKWGDDEVVEVFETGMVRPNLLSIMREGRDYHIRGILKEGENPLNYKKGKGLSKDVEAKEEKKFDGVFYDTEMEESLDRIAGKKLAEGGKGGNQEEPKVSDGKDLNQKKRGNDIKGNSSRSVPNVQKESFDLFQGTGKSLESEAESSNNEEPIKVTDKSENDVILDNDQGKVDTSKDGKENPDELLNKIKDNLQLDASSRVEIQELDSPESQGK